MRLYGRPRELRSQESAGKRYVTLLYKIINRFAPAYLARKISGRSGAHSYSTRHKDQLQSPFCGTATAQDCFFIVQ